jgi:small-conductance mechanosensitive channel
MPDLSSIGGFFKQIVLAGLTFAGVSLAFIFLRRVVVDRLQALAELSEAGLRELLLGLRDQFRGLEGLFIALYLALRSFELGAKTERVLYIAIVAVLSYRAASILSGLTRYFVRRSMLEEGQESLAQQGAARNVIFLISVLIWLTAGLVVMSSLGVHIAAVLTGLGIGGVAVALAGQAILSDFFSAVAIFLDKPFVVGDAIAVGELSGTVERIGIKTTRVRADSGEVLVFPNSALASAKIRNFRAMRLRRVVFRFGVPLDTPSGKLKDIPGLVSGAVANLEKARFERAHLVAFGESALQFEVSYVVLDTSYDLYLNLNQRILLTILEGLQKDGIALAAPARVVRVEARLPAVPPPAGP